MVKEKKTLRGTRFYLEADVKTIYQTGNRRLIVYISNMILKKPVHILPVGEDQLPARKTVIVHLASYAKVFQARALNKNIDAKMI